MPKEFLKRIDYRKLYCYVILFMMFYTSDSIYTYVYWNLDHLLEIMTDFFMLVLIFRLPKKRVKEIVTFVFVVGFVMFLINLINGVFNQELFYLSGLVLRISSVAVFVAWVVEEQIPVLSYAANLIVVIASFFLVCFVCFDLNILGISSEVAEISYEVARESSKTMALECYAGFYYKWDSARPLFGYQIPSVNGFWREPGVTQIFYNFALFFYWFIESERKKVITSIILFVSVILAMSTMGLLILIGLVALKILMRNKYAKWLLPMIVIGVAMIGIPVFLQRYPNVAVSNRWVNLVTAIDRWKLSPIFGLGYSRDNVSWYGLINYFINWGLLGACPILVIVWGLKQNIITKDIYGKIACLGWWAASLLNEAAGYNMFFLMLYFLIVFNTPNLFSLKSERKNQKSNADDSFKKKA